MNNVLVMSDNAALVKFFMNDVFCGKRLINTQVDYVYSVKNLKPEALRELGMRSIDFKSDQELCEVIARYDLIISAHCKQIFPEKLVESVKCINIHPGYNPYNRGWYPQVFSIINGYPVGATIHEMDADIDHGNIIDQQMVPVRSYDTSFDVYNKILSVEKDLILRNIDSIIRGDYVAIVPSFEGNYNSVSDFKRMCCLGMEHVGTLKEHLNLLRALTFNGYKNAFYCEDEKKVYVSISFMIDDNADG